MNYLLQVPEHEITKLEDSEFRPLMNQLLIAEGRRHGVPTSAIETTNEDNISDGGVDALISHSVDVPENCRIPPGLSVWQYKAGNAPAAEIQHESQKQGVKEAIANGGSYCFVVGQSCTSSMRRSRERALSDAFSGSGKSPRSMLYTAAEIAEWVSDYPVIAAQLLRFQIPDDLYTFQQWDSLAQSGTTIAYQINDRRHSIIGSITAALNDPSRLTCIRLSGADGIGKTRLVLEAIRAAEAQSFTFYAVTPEAVPEDLFSFIQARTSIERLVLVVDECNHQDFRNSQRRAERCNGRLTLITIGSEDTEATGELEQGVLFHALDRLDGQTIQRIVELAAPLLQPEVQMYIARTVDGRVKLAIALAESLATNRDIHSVSESLALPKVKFILNSLVRNDEERDAMYVLSLLRFVGVDGDASDEARILAGFLGLDSGRLKHVAHHMQQRGLVIKRGRFRYVTPALLAVWFARELWEARGADLVSTLIPRLPSASTRYRMLERLGDIGEERFALEVVASYFGRQGELASIDALDDEGAAKLFYTLANAAPVSCAQALERITRGASHQRLLEFRNGRRYVVYALERLLRLKDTFMTAARIMLKLAAAENETHSNNASGIWQDIFYIHLGLSPLPAWERHALIQEAISPGNSQAVRLLGVKAVSRSLAQTQFTTYGEGPGGHFSERWHPATWDDVWRTRRSALELLDPLLTDMDEYVRQEAVSAFVEAVPVLLASPLKGETLVRLEKRVSSLPSEYEKRKLIEILEHAIKFEIPVLTEDEIAKIQEWRQSLWGNAYRDRLRRWVGDLNWADSDRVYSDREDRVSLERVLADLARDGYETPDSLQAELHWLTSPEAYRSGAIAFELGALDVDGSWLDKLLSFLPNASHFISSYLAGHSSAGRTDWVIDVLQEWVERSPDLSEAVLLTIQWLEGCDRHAQWIIDLLQKGWLQPEQLSGAWRSGWLGSISGAVFVPLLQHLTDKDESQRTAIALDLIGSWMESHPRQPFATAKYIVSLLKRVPGERKNYFGGANWYQWRRICLFYLREFTTDIVEAAVHLMRSWQNVPDSPEDDRIFVLIGALRISPELAWPVIGKALLSGTQGGYFWPPSGLRSSTRELDTGALIEAVDHSTLMSWAEENGLLAAQTLAEFVNVECTPLPMLVRELIIRFGNDKLVRGRLHPALRGMVWSGPYSARLQGMLKVVRTWLQDESEAVRTWAREIAEDIEVRIQQNQSREDEENLFW